MSEIFRSSFAQGLKDAIMEAMKPDGPLYDPEPFVCPKWWTPPSEPKESDYEIRNISYSNRPSGLGIAFNRYAMEEAIAELKELHTYAKAYEGECTLEPKCECGSGSNAMGPGHSDYCACYLKA